MLCTRDELAVEVGLSKATLSNLWAKREENGHPPAITTDGRMRWDLATWRTWHRDLQSRRATATTTRDPDFTGDPEETVGPAEAAKVCGFADTSVISGYMKNPPAGWPEPDDWDVLPTRRRPRWKRATLWNYVRNRAPRGQAAGRPAGRSGGQAYPYQGDPRLTLARQVLAEHPGARNSELIPLLAERSEKPYSRPTWNNILKSARDNEETP
ncbi:hypothetical protein ACN20G_11870 [Streptomyces sp. BI20]|uniref:hypothetical protein n=1 Tax=Streptomyces sp. BI20 TaxID=3403460 RepID=UPI003C747A2B